jgi:hypothetical protein
MMTIKCEKCYNEMPIIHYPGVGSFIEPCKYCQEEGLISTITEDDLNDSYEDGYYDALSEVRESLDTIRTDISTLGLDIESLLLDMKKIDKKRENE